MNVKSLYACYQEVEARKKLAQKSLDIYHPNSNLSRTPMIHAPQILLAAKAASTICIDRT